MTPAYSPERFDALVDELYALSVHVLKSKREEYSPGSDRLKNFHDVASFLGVKPSTIAMTYLLKHVQSLATASATGSYSWSVTTDAGGEGLKQRIADVINYAFLIAACLE